jgi:hypothetical protein
MTLALGVTLNTLNIKGVAMTEKGNNVWQGADPLIYTEFPRNFGPECDEVTGQYDSEPDVLVQERQALAEAEPASQNMSS